jgi:hypothetical protein
MPSGTWNGTAGISSTSAAVDTTHLTAIGVIQNNQGGSALYTSKNLFDGYAPGASDILIKFTYYGDANLDGKVDGSDYVRIDSGYLTHATGWYNGDFNYDGVVNGSDFTLIDNAFNSQGASLAASISSPTAEATAEIAGSTPVPEPASVALMALAGAQLLGRRRHRWDRQGELKQMLAGCRKHRTADVLAQGNEAGAAAQTVGAANNLMVSIHNRVKAVRASCRRPPASNWLSWFGHAARQPRSHRKPRRPGATPNEPPVNPPISHPSDGAKQREADAKHCGTL